MHNLKTVYSFEFIRTLKKRSFWIISLSFPLAAMLIFAVVFFSNQATQKAAKDTSNQQYSLAVVDDSHLVSPIILKHLNATILGSKQEGIDTVKQGKYDAFFYFPAHLSSDKVETYGKDVGLFNDNRYQVAAQAILSQSVAGTVNANIATILQKNVQFASTTYRDGQIYDGIQQLIAPGIFLVLFYILIVTFGNQMLTSTTEEKENRIIEMLLTTVQARTLIIGKILSLVTLALVQIVIILIPIVIAYLLLHNQLNLPNLDLTNIPFDPVRVTFGALLFISSFILFTGLLVAISAAMPTAKEASGFFGLVMILLFGPLYAASLFVSAPTSPIVTFLSFFPLTAPIPLLLRNAIGNLSIPNALLGVAILAVAAALIMTIAIRLFKYGALEYSRRLSLKTVLVSRRAR